MIFFFFFSSLEILINVSGFQKIICYYELKSIIIFNFTEWHKITGDNAHMTMTSLKAAWCYTERDSWNTFSPTEELLHSNRAYLHLYYSGTYSSDKLFTGLTAKRFSLFVSRPHVSENQYVNKQIKQVPVFAYFHLQAAQYRAECLLRKSCHFWCSLSHLWPVLRPLLCPGGTGYQTWSPQTYLDLVLKIHLQIRQKHKYHSCLLHTHIWKWTY